MAFRLTKAAKLAIGELAVCYSEYCRVIRDPGMKDRDVALCVWGGNLRAKQKELGVELLDDETIRILIDHARESRGIAA
jgi:hypothetical protein